MKTLVISLTLFAQTAFALIGESERQIEARYGKPKKVVKERGESRVASYVAHGFTINVRFIGGISTTEWFQSLDKSTFTEEDVERALALSADKGQTWHSTPLPQPNAPRCWTRSDDKVSAIATGNLVNVYRTYSVQPK